MSKQAITIQVKRLEGEVRDLDKNRIDECQAIQDKSDSHKFYFMLRGDDGSDYEGGYYIGKIQLPPEYPDKAGKFYMLTPNGRFMIDQEICLTNSAYHPESWNTLWSIRNMIIGFYSIFIVDDTHGISHIRETPAQRKDKAKNSVAFNKSNYPEIFKMFDQYVKEDGTMRTDMKEIKKYVEDYKKKVVKEEKEEKKRKKKEKKAAKKAKKEAKKAKKAKKESKNDSDKDVKVIKVKDDEEDNGSSSEEDVEQQKVLEKEEHHDEGDKSPTVEKDMKEVKIVMDKTDQKIEKDMKEVKIVMDKTDQKIEPLDFSGCKSLDDLLEAVDKTTIYTFNPKLYEAVERAY
jgi:ubiquitin-protein ligase